MYIYYIFTSSSRLALSKLPWAAVLCPTGSLPNSYTPREQQFALNRQILVYRAANTVSLTTLADCGPFTMSEVRPGGDSSDPLAEMTKPQNLQKLDSSAESLRPSHGGNRHFENQFDDKERLLSDNEQNTKPQFSIYNPETVEDSEAVQSSTDVNAEFAAKVHIRQLFVGNV
jgi:hypothetical protein